MTFLIEKRVKYEQGNPTMIVLDLQTSGGLAAFTGSRGGGRGESITPPPRGGGGGKHACAYGRATIQTGPENPVGHRYVHYTGRDVCYPA